MASFCLQPGANGVVSPSGRTPERLPRGQYMVLYLVRILLYRQTVFLLITLCTWYASVQLAHAQNVTTGDLPVESESFSYEIHRIEFTGNNAFPPEKLQGVIASRKSEKSLTRGLVEYFREQLQHNPAAPSTYIDAMQRIEKQAGDIREYFNREQVAEDTIALASYYRENGFHLATVSADFGFDTRTNENVLTFRIAEGKQAAIDTIVYVGLENIPDVVAKKIQSTISVEPAIPFNQGEIIAQNERILHVLHSNGYFYARYNRPDVLYLPENNTDSITVVFAPGKRQRIGHIAFVDSLAGQPPVSYNTRREQLAFAEGDWYNRDAFAESERNLYSLDVFEIATIDTSSAFHPITDSTLSIEVFTLLRKAQEISITPLVSKNATEDFWNLGAEVSYTHKNIFGAAQKLNPYAGVFIRDITGSIDRGKELKDFQIEQQAGLRFSQPYLTNLFGSRLGINFQPQYSNRTVLNPLRIEAFTLRTSLPLTLPPWVFINAITLDIDIERQRPVNMEETFGELAAVPGTDTTLLLRQLLQYLVLDAIINEQGKPLSSAVVSLSLVSDSRNNPFTPNRGNFFSASTEYGGVANLGGARFVRLNMFDYWFTSPNEKDVLALKLRLGHTIWWERNQSFIPVERHFFAGGSNSIRAFASRSLRSVPANDNSKELADIVGSGSLIEGSVEYRWKLRAAPLSESFWEDKLARFGITTFLDFGNTYNSLLEDDDLYGSMPLLTVLQKIALGFGTGFRFDTPVGPFRVDVATRLYDPMVATNQWFWERPFSVRWQFGIGHAF